MRMQRAGSTSQEERPRKETALLTPSSQTSRLQSWETTNAHCLSCPFCGTSRGSLSRMTQCHGLKPHIPPADTT